MEKLQPLIVHRFWIILVVALALPFVGHWMTTGKLAAEIDSRFTAVNGAFNAVPKTESANPKWKEGLVEMNQDQSQRVQEAVDFLWKTQKPLMVWPPRVQMDVDKATYRGELPNNTLQKYRTDYVNEIERVWRLADPYIEQTRTGKLVLDPSKLQKFDFQESAPTSPQAWDAQEDIWLTAALMKALARVNAGAIAHGDAFIKELKTFQLVGGTGTPADSQSLMAGLAGMLGGVDLFGQPVSPGDPSSLGLGGSRNLLYGQAKTDFPPADEFGPETPQGGIGAPGSGGLNDPRADPNAPAAALGGDPGGGMFSSGPVARRYVEDVEAYKTRGFYLVLVMDHRRVPDLIVELTNSPWPVRICRVHQNDVSTDNLQQTGAPGTGTAAPRSATRSMVPQTTDVSSMMGMLSLQPGGPGMTPGIGNYSQVHIDKDDPYLSIVAVCGLMTIYKPPQALAPAPGGTAPPANTLPQPVAEAPAAAAIDTAAPGAAPVSTPAVPAEATPATSAPAAPAGDTLNGPKQ